MKAAIRVAAVVLALGLIAFGSSGASGQSRYPMNGTYSCSDPGTGFELFRLSVSDGVSSNWSSPEGIEYHGRANDTANRYVFQGQTDAGEAIKIDLRAFTDSLLGDARIGSMDFAVHCSEYRGHPGTHEQSVGRPSVAYGTGFYVNAGGLVVTSAHVIAGAGAVFVRTSSGKRLPAVVVSNSLSNDIAIVRVDGPTPDYLSLAPTRTTKVGQTVFTYGFPVADILGPEPKFTDGSISALSGLQGEPSFLQMSVPVQPGNSGGPLVNDSGEVVGIIASQAAIAPFLKMTGTLPQNVNWAVKAEYVGLLVELPPARPKTASRQVAIERVRRAIVVIEAE